jgi:uncharacterized damage-inducible protein DinB
MPSFTFPVSSERDALNGFLDLQREALIRKLEGLSDADARQAVTVSSLSLLALVKHSAIWEQRWFQVILAGRADPGGWPEVRDHTDPDLRVGDDDTVAHWVARYREAIAESRAVVAGRDLHAPCARADISDRNTRWVLLHMIEETARHAGHADIIRETLDGSRGMWTEARDD